MLEARLALCLVFGGMRWSPIRGVGEALAGVELSCAFRPYYFECIIDHRLVQDGRNSVEMVYGDVLTR